MLEASSAGVFVPAVGAFAGVLVTAVVTYVETRRRFLTDLAHDYDLALRSNRVEVYPALWKLTEALPRYGKEHAAAVSDLLELIESLRAWYFETGGLFLSTDSRDAYFAFQDDLSRTTRGRDARDALTDDEREQLRSSGSALRTALAADIRSRRRAELSEADGRT
jgi:hypothetical protein